MQFRANAAAVQSAQGLDVANFQGKFDWTAAKQQVPQLAFGVYKATEGLNFTDADAQHNHDAIAANGLHRGSYHFLHPDLDGAAQANFFMQEMDRLGMDSSHMLWLDNETQGASPPAQVAACAQRFMHELDQIAPHNPRGIYSYVNFIRDGNCAGLGGYPLWLAFPALLAPADPPPWHHWTFWQWGMRNGDDADAFNGTAAALQAWIESFLPQTHGPYRHISDGTKSLAEIAKERGTTVEHLAQTTAGALRAGDITAIMTAAANAPLPAGFPWYSTSP